MTTKADQLHELLGIGGSTKVKGYHHSLTNVGMKKGDWEKLLHAIGAPVKPTIDRAKLTFVWTGKDVSLMSNNDASTGMRVLGQGLRDYVGDLTISGDRRVVEPLAEKVKQVATNFSMEVGGEHAYESATPAEQLLASLTETADASAIVRELNVAHAAMVHMIVDLHNEEEDRIPKDVTDVISSTQRALAMLGFEKTAKAMTAALQALRQEAS